MHPVSTAILAALCIAAGVHAAVEPTAMTEGWLRKMLSQFPQADADGDGTLSQAEADAYIKRMYDESPEMWGANDPPAGTSQWTTRVAMRDGARLTTEVFLPPGHGPWPVVLVRTPYGRVGNGLAFGRRYLTQGMALVSQDPRGLFALGGPLRRPAQQHRRRLRYGRVGGRAAMVQRQGGDGRDVGARHHRQAGGHRASAAPGGGRADSGRQQRGPLLVLQRRRPYARAPTTGCTRAACRCRTGPARACPTPSPSPPPAPWPPTRAPWTWAGATWAAGSTCSRSRPWTTSRPSRRRAGPCS